MLLERQRYLDQLAAGLASAHSGRGSIMFVVGEAGIGKTSLLAEFASETTVIANFRLLRVAFEDLNAPEGFSILRGSSLIGDAEIDRAQSGDSRLSMFATILSRLAEQPTVFLVEDLHWADDASMDMLRYIGRRIADWPVLAVVTSRNEEVGARGRLQRAMADIPADSRARIDLPRLTRHAVDQLAARAGIAGTTIHETSGGNPLLVAEMLASGSGQSALIEDLVIARADRLSEGARDVLDRCSIIPRHVPIELAEAMELADRGLAECLESGLLLEQPEGIAFRHEITRRAVENALLPTKRRRLHREALSLLEQQKASAARRLHHAAAAGDQETIVSLAPGAAEQASALGAHREAARAWQILLEYREVLPESLLARAHERLAYEMHLNGGARESVEEISAAAAIHHRLGDRLNEGNCLRWKSRFHYVDGDRDAARDSAQMAIALLEPLGDGAELAMVYSTLSQLFMLDDETDEAIRWGELAIAMARAVERPDIEAHALDNVGASLRSRDLERGLALVRQGEEICFTHGFQEEACRALTNQYSMLCLSRLVERSIEIANRCVEHSLLHDIDLFRDYALGYRALAFIMLGSWDKAASDVERVLANPDGTRLTRNPAVRAAAQLAMRRDGADISEYLAELTEHMGKGRERQRFYALALIAAESAWTGGEDQATAKTLLDQAWEMQNADTDQWDVSELWFWRRKLLGKDDPPRFMPLAGPFQLLRDGAPSEAARAAAAAKLPFLSAFLLAEGGEEDAGLALEQLSAIGALATAARIRADLGQRGIRTGRRGPRASTRSNRFGLTKREIDVLGWLEKGLTNKEIGDRLYVSPKTIDHHVSSLLGKLAVRNRGEAVSFGRAEGLIDA